MLSVADALSIGHARKILRTPARPGFTQVMRIFVIDTLTREEALIQGQCIHTFRLGRSLIVIFHCTRPPCLDNKSIIANGVTELHRC